MAIDIHVSSPAGVNRAFIGSGALTTATFSPPAGSLLVAVVSAEDAVTLANSGTARTWTKRVGGALAGTSIWTAPNPTALTNITVTATTAGGGLKVYVVTGQHTTSPIGTTGTGDTTVNNATVTGYTSTAAGSRGFCAAIEVNNRGLPASTDDEYAYNQDLDGLCIVKAANTGTTSTAVTFNLDAAGSSVADWVWAALEILPAPSDVPIDATVVDAVADIPTPGLSAGQTVQPATVDAVADIPTPGRSAGQTVHPAVVDAVAVIATPSVTAGFATLVEPATVTATANIPSPTVTAIQNASPSPATVTAAADIPSPTITATRQAVIAPASVDALADIPTPGLQVPVLPGETITRDGQVEWGYAALWGWNDFSVREITGWVDAKPPLDDLTVDDPARHGAIAGSSLAKRRIVTVKLQVNSLGDPTQLSALLRQLRYDTRTLRDNTLWPLVIRGRTETLMAFGKVIDRTGVYDANWSIGSVEPVITIMCPDPRCYSLEQNSTVIAAGGTETLVNDGDVYTSPILRFPGPALNPVIMNETLDRVLGFDLTLISGQRLDVDTQRGSVRIGTANHMSDLADSISVPVKEFFLDVGASDITYETDSGGAAGAEVIWRSATM